MNSWMGFCLYVAGGVFVHDIKLGQPSAPNSPANLDFLLVAMKQIGKRHTITDHFTAQLEFDIEVAGIRNFVPRYAKQMAQMGVVTEASPNASESPSSNSACRDRDASYGQACIGGHLDRVKTLAQQPLAGIISYSDIGRCLYAVRENRSNAMLDLPSRFFISAQKPVKSQRDRSRPTNDLSTNAPNTSHTGSYDAYLEGKEKWDANEANEASEINIRQSSNNVTSTWPDTNAAVPWITDLPNDCKSPKPYKQKSTQGMTFFGVQNTGEHHRQNVIRTDHRPQQNGTVVGNSAQQPPVRENDFHKSPEYHMWNTQDMNTYSFDPGWQFDLDPNMQPSFPLEGEGVREFINNFGLSNWNSNAG